MAVKKIRSSKKKKTVTKKKTIRKAAKKPFILNELKKVMIGLAVLAAICLTLAMIADIFIQPGLKNKEIKKIAEPKDKEKRKPIEKDTIAVKQIKKETGLKGKSQKIITYEVFKDLDQTIVDKPVIPVKDKIPRIAIIIDDIGYDRKTAMALYALSPDLTFSILPFSPYGKVLAKRLNEKGAQLMLHLPMEPVEIHNADPGPGAILSSMSPDVLLEQLKKNLREIPYIVGVNNHMGSKLTTQANQMNQVFSILKKENLFFIDSRTAPKSQCKASARLFKLKFAQRDVFLDNIQEQKYITGQFEELISLAKKHGSAVGIGHPYKATLLTLSTELLKLKDKVKIVRARTLTYIIQ
ncbi:MAG: divergent polysaccharide deacetylase family protein [Desulfobacula sp.]|nr:divergent polysaccharide deacetylase family protein [Desulfobacula sp.]